MYTDRNISVRDASIDDLDRIVEIYNSTVPGRMVTADTEPVTVESRKKWFYEHSTDLRPLWVAENDGKVCAWLSYQSFYGRPAYNATAELSIYVAEECRRMGLGSFLLGHAIDSCPRLKLKTLLGFIFGHNAPSLQLFYRYGFTNWGVFPGIAELDGIERDLIIVGKRVCT